MKTTQKNLLFIKSILSVVFVFICFVNTKAQINYVQNPSFEDYDTCPNYIGQIRYASNWNSLPDGTGGSTDFFHSCASPNVITGVPSNGWGQNYQYPKTGNGYALVATMDYFIQNPNLCAREYATGKLKQKLTANKSYCVKAYINLSEQSYCGADGFGFYFDNGTITANPVSMLVNKIPQVENPSMNIIMDSVGWVEVSGTFVAEGIEEYITLGNFKDNANTHYIPTPNEPGIGYYVAAYNVDDISVIESDLPAFAGNDTALQNVGDSLYLGRPAEIGLECVWYNWAGDSIGTGAGIWVTPSHTQPYIVEQNLCGTIKRDTVYVSVGTSVENEAIFEGLKVFPNPSEGAFVIQSQNFERFSTVEIAISDISGKVLYQESFEAQERIEIQTDFPAGVYLLQVQDSQTGAKAIRRLLLR